MFKFLFVIFFSLSCWCFLMGFSILRTFKNIFLVAETALVRENNVVKQIAILPDIVLRLLPPDDDDDRTPYVHRKKIFAKDEGYVDYEEVK